MIPIKRLIQKSVQKYQLLTLIIFLTTSFSQSSATPLHKFLSEFNTKNQKLNANRVSTTELEISVKDLQAGIVMLKEYVNKGDEKGVTPLQWACEQLNEVTKKGSTRICWVNSLLGKIIRHLIAAGADVVNGKWKMSDDKEVPFFEGFMAMACANRAVHKRSHALNVQPDMYGPMCYFIDLIALKNGYVSIPVNYHCNINGLCSESAKRNSKLTFDWRLYHYPDPEKLGEESTVENAYSYLREQNRDLWKAKGSKVNEEAFIKIFNYLKRTKMFDGMYLVDSYNKVTGVLAEHIQVAGVGKIIMTFLIHPDYLDHCVNASKVPATTYYHVNEVRNERDLLRHEAMDIPKLIRLEPPISAFPENSDRKESGRMSLT